MNSTLIDAGHGLPDPGAVTEVDNRKLFEADLNLAVSCQMMKMVALGSPADLFLIRNSRYNLAVDHSSGLRLRVKLASEFDQVVSIHINSYYTPTPQGIETLYWHNNSVGFAEIIHRNILSGNPSRKNRGVKRVQLYVLSNISKPVCLVELGFMSNPDDLHYLLTEGIERYAEGIIKGLEEYDKRICQT